MIFFRHCGTIYTSYSGCPISGSRCNCLFFTHALWCYEQ